MDQTAFESWAMQVITCINADSERCSLYDDALAHAARETGEPVPATSSASVLEWLRQDEPQDAFEAGDKAEDYAGFLLTEWDLYGPEGE